MSLPFYHVLDNNDGYTDPFASPEISKLNIAS
jgi:hypothetical protein